MSDVKLIYIPRDSLDEAVEVLALAIEDDPFFDMYSITTVARILTNFRPISSI